MCNLNHSLILFSASYVVQDTRMSIRVPCLSPLITSLAILTPTSLIFSFTSNNLVMVLSSWPCVLISFVFLVGALEAFDFS